MKTYVSKRNEIKVIGQWTGGEDEVTQWLTDNDYTWKIQFEEDDSLLDALNQEQEYQDATSGSDPIDAEAHKRLVIIGTRLWQQWQLNKGELLVLREKRSGDVTLWVTDTQNIKAEFDEVAENA
jgi:hypothetical protein